MRRALKRVAGQLDNDPQRIKDEIEAQIAHLYEQLDELADGRRPEPDLVNLEDEARVIAFQMEQVISDIVRYGSRQNEITTGLIDTDDSDTGFREQSHQLFTGYGELFGSREKASYAEFTRLVQDPDKRARLRGDIAVVVDQLPDLDSGLRQVMTDFFRLVSAQIAEVSRIEQRCALRIKRFFAAGTAEQARGVARQLNEAILSGHALLRKSVVDSPIAVQLPVGWSAVSSIGASTFDIKDLRPPKAAAEAPSVVDVSQFAALATRVDMAELARLVNAAVAVAPVTLAEMIGMVDTPYLGDVVVLWAMARKQDRSEDAPGVRVRFKSIDGRDRAVSVPALMFTEPVAAPEGVEP